MNLRADITNSERRSSACAHLWLLRYGLGLTASTQTRAMRTGTLVHDGLDALATGGDPLEALRDTFEEMLDRLQPAGVVDPSSPGFYADPEELQATYDESVALVERYVERYGVDAGFDEVLACEKTLRAPARTPSGNPSPVTFIAGKLDLLVRINGDVWLVERKTTSKPLEDWFYQHRYDPQALTYAWLVRETMGIECKGILYDTILRKVPGKPADLGSTKPTKNDPTGRLKKTNGLPNVTSTGLVEAALRVHGHPHETPFAPTRAALEELVASYVKPDAVAWYLEAFDALEAREQGSHYFRRDFELFCNGAIDRAGRELYHNATTLRRWRNRVAPFRQQIADAVAGKWDDGNGPTAPHFTGELLREVGDEFPRNPSMCWRYNRKCSLAEVCEQQSDDAASRLRVRVALHSELEDDDTTEVE